jgi:hypothetical protein
MLFYIIENQNPYSGRKMTHFKPIYLGIIQPLILQSNFL